MEKSKQIELTDEEKEVLRKHHEAKKKALLAELAIGSLFMYQIYT